MRRRGVIVLAIMVMLAVTTPAAASPSTENLLGRPARSAVELQAQIDHQLKLAPGGTQTAPNEVSYDNGRFVVTFAMPGTGQPMGSADCPHGWFCFYDYTNYGYPRGKLSDKGRQDLATWAGMTTPNPCTTPPTQGSTSTTTPLADTGTTSTCSAYLRTVRPPTWPRTATWPITWSGTWS